MPWQIKDVDSHKKGLSDKQKAQWCRIANSVLAACIKKGGTDKTCAPSAIKQANGVVMNANESKGVYSTYKSKQILDYEPKLTIHQEKAHLVIPVVMMIEGVHNGSQGPLLHEISELGKFPESWNGRPIVIYHPEDENGNPISANSPEIADKITVGRVYNTTVEDKKLKAEVWFDEDKLNTVSPETLQDINDRKEIEVSLGMFTENEDVEGEYEGEKYKGIAHNHRPDHLAVLPDQVGACSCKDGCGIGANQNNKDMAKLIDVEKTIRQLNSEGFSISQIGNNTSQGYQEKMQMVNEALRKLDKSDSYNYLEEMYDKYLVYRSNGNGESKLYKQEYEITKGVLNLIGNATVVQKKVDYVNVNKDIQPSQATEKAGVGDNDDKVSINLKKEDKMSENKCPKCVEKINALIANKESGFVETDREMLNALTEPQLDKLMPKVIEKIVEKKVEVEVNKLTPEQTADLAYLAKQRADRKSEVIKGIQDNTSKEVWPDDVLKGMSEDHLNRLFTSVKKEEKVDYSLNGVGQFGANAGEVEALYPTGVEIEVKK